MSFFLLNLPILAIQEVIKYFYVADLIDFSLCSVRCERVVQSMKHPYSGIDIVIGNDNHLILKVGGSRYFQWAFQKLKTPKRGIDENEMRKINGTRMRVVKSEEMTSSKNPEHHIKIVFDYLRDLFNLSVSNYYQFNSRNLSPQFFEISKCEMAWISTALSNFQIEQILKNVKISKTFILNTKKQPDFTFDSARFDVEELDITSAHWLSRDSFLTANCSRITLTRPSLSPKDYLDFVTQWFRSGSVHFEWLKVSNVPNLDFNYLPVKPWDPEVRGRYYRFTNPLDSSRRRLDCWNGMDLTRSDGLTATLMTTSTTLYFLVWHNRFPICDGLSEFSSF